MFNKISIFNVKYVDKEFECSVYFPQELLISRIQRCIHSGKEACFRSWLECAYSTGANAGYFGFCKASDESTSI